MRGQYFIAIYIYYNKAMQMDVVLLLLIHGYKRR